MVQLDMKIRIIENQVTENMLRILSSIILREEPRQLICATATTLASPANSLLVR